MSLFLGNPNLPQKVAGFFPLMPTAGVPRTCDTLRSTSKRANSPANTSLSAAISMKLPLKLLYITDRLPRRTPLGQEGLQVIQCAFRGDNNIVCV